MVEYSPKDKITVLCDRERLLLLACGWQKKAKLKFMKKINLIMTQHLWLLQRVPSKVDNVGKG